MAKFLSPSFPKTVAKSISVARCKAAKCIGIVLTRCGRVASPRSGLRSSISMGLTSTVA